MSKLWLPSRRSLIQGVGAALIVSRADALTPNHSSVLFGGIKPYLGIVATRGQVPNFGTAANKQFNTRSLHRAAVAIPRLKIIIPNWYVSESSTHPETPGAASTFTASVEYPAGTFTQIKFSGSTSAAIAGGGQVVSDWCNVFIPSGASFFIRMFCTSATGILYINSTGPFPSGYVAGGEALQLAVSGLSDMTLSGTITDANSGAYRFAPLAVLGMTVNPSVLCLGDSRCWGYGDTFTASVDIGEICRSIGKNFGYCNLGTPADEAQYFVASPTNRVALAQYASHIVSEYGINDMYVSSQTGAQTLASLAQIRALFPSKRFFQSTISPVTSSSDGWATLGNQTINANVTPGLVTVNDGIRAGNGGITGYFDVASVTMSSLDSLLWNVSAGVYTADGLHGNQAACLGILAASVINPTRFK